MQTPGNHNAQTSCPGVDFFRGRSSGVLRPESGDRDRRLSWLEDQSSAAAACGADLSAGNGQWLGRPFVSAAHIARCAGNDNTVVNAAYGADPSEPTGASNSDVRMRGFVGRSTVDEALNWIDRCLPNFSSLSTEVVCLSAAAGRVLAADVISQVDVPGFRRAMMDGYAVRADETFGASAYNPLPFESSGTSFPGRPYAGIVGPGQAVRIMTGSPMPEGADAVLPVEQTECVDGVVCAAGEVTAGKHVGRIGEDVRCGEVVVKGGRRLRPQDVGVLSAMGISEVAVVRPPRVRILVTGDELLPAGTPPQGFRIADANGPMLAALAKRDGGIAVCDEIISDSADLLLAAMRQSADVILVSGGSSVGQEDHAPVLLAQHGELAIHGIAMRPSSPAGMGQLDGRLVFLLPGNPVSCLCAYDFFAGRAIRRLSGRSGDWPHRVIRLPLSRKLISTVGRVDYARVRLVDNQVEPLAISGASILSSTTRADGFVIVPADSEGYAAGSNVDVLLYD